MHVIVYSSASQPRRGPSRSGKEEPWPVSRICFTAHVNNSSRPCNDIVNNLGIGAGLFWLFSQRVDVDISDIGSPSTNITIDLKNTNNPTLRQTLSNTNTGKGPFVLVLCSVNVGKFSFQKTIWDTKQMDPLSASNVNNDADTITQTVTNSNVNNGWKWYKVIAMCKTWSILSPI